MQMYASVSAISNLLLGSHGAPLTFPDPRTVFAVSYKIDTETSRGGCVHSSQLPASLQAERSVKVKVLKYTL
jgi:hypothetical protein